MHVCRPLTIFNDGCGCVCHSLACDCHMKCRCGIVAIANKPCTLSAIEGDTAFVSTVSVRVADLTTFSRVKRGKCGNPALLVT